MDLVNFLEWEDCFGMYKGKVDGEFYRVVDNKLEIYDSNLLDWKACDMPINEYYKLKSVERVGEWAEGFAIMGEEEWKLVKNYYSQKGYYVPHSVTAMADRYTEKNFMFYTWIHYGILQAGTFIELRRRDLMLRLINRPQEPYLKYVGKESPDSKMFWQIEQEIRERVN